MNLTAANYRFARSSYYQQALADFTDTDTSAVYPNVAIYRTGIVQSVAVPATFSGVQATLFNQQALLAIRPLLLGGNADIPV